MNNFNNYKVIRFKYYDGQNGKKLCLQDENGTRWMLKTPPKKNQVYSNSCISEHLGCKIFDSLGFKTQETKLGIYTINAQDKLCVICKDFEVNNKKLFKFAQVKNGIIDSPESGYGVELEEVLEAIEEQGNINPILLKRFYWDMFIADAFVGNFDRHNGNWGLLLDDILETSEIAPVYDCGSCLYSKMKEEDMRNILSDSKEIDARVYIFPQSALKIEGRKINYFEFISSGQNKDCTEALKRISPKINLEEINGIIDNMEYISDLQKEFYKTMLEQRKTKIIDKSLELLLLKDVSKNIENLENDDFDI